MRPAMKYYVEMASTPIVDKEEEAIERSSSSSSSSTTSQDISVNECVCGDHSGNLLLDQVYPKTQSELFDLMFTASPWFVQLNSALQRTAHSKLPLKYSGYVASDWVMVSEDDVKQRTCTYTMALNYAMAPKSCAATEKQVCTAFPGGFTVVKDTVSSGVPYADSFHVSCTYCVAGAGRGQARLTVHGGLVFTKSVWGIIRGFIERSTVTGMTEHYDAVHAALTEECKRSSTGADDDPLEEDVNSSLAAAIYRIGLQQEVRGDAANNARAQR